ncbi:MAG: hypothetical protein ACI8RD_006833, partial [Bacillariaceae sp.]|jgi:hypothetical protein
VEAICVKEGIFSFLNADELLFASKKKMIKDKEKETDQTFKAEN